MSNKKLLYLLISLLILPPIIIFLSRQFFPANYFFSSLYKIIFLFPIFFYTVIEKKTFKEALFSNFSWQIFKKNISRLSLIGVSLATVYISGFLLFQNRLDLTAIAAKLGELISLNLSNLIFIGLYIIIINSLLEEYFWRGLMFQRLRNLIKPWQAHALTGIAFSFHHVMFYYNWFDLGFVLIATIGLAVYSIIMNLIFERYKDLFSCWLVHGFADVAQIVIAFRIFGLI